MSVYDTVRLWAVLIVACGQFSYGSAHTSYNLYCIGNSLTWGAKPNLLEYPFSSLGYVLDVDYHIACGKSLNYMLSDPEFTCVDSLSGDTWIERLSSEAIEFDAVVFQPHLGASLAEELSAISRMIAIATEGGRNLGTHYYILYTWPRNLENLPADELWLQALDLDASGDEGDEEAMKNTLAHFDYLLSEIRRLQPGISIHAVPVGSVLYALAEQLKKEDEGASASMGDFYSDSIHLKWASGEFISHLVLAATLLRSEPSELSFYPNWINAVDADLLSLAEEVTASVLDNSFRTDIEFPPRMQFSRDKLYFRGQLYQSENLVDWSPFDSVVSPICLKSLTGTPNSRRLFYRVEPDT
jgi:hypothetical protein